MSQPSFPPRLRSRRAPITTAQRDSLRHATGGALLAVAVSLAAALRDVPTAALLASLTVALFALVVVDPGKHLLATVAPLPDVHTPPVTGADLVTCMSTARISLPAHELALAGAVGVYRVGAHSVRAVAEADTATTAIPQVQA